MLNKKIIVFGNSQTKGLAGSLCRLLKGDGFGRKTHGYDLKVSDQRQQFITKSLNYDVAILCAYGADFSQVLLLKELYTHWLEKNKRGRIVTVGSSCERLLQGRAVESKWLSYPVEKRALGDMVRLINANSESLSPGILASHISPHHMNTEHFSYPEALNVEQVTGAIRYVLEADFHIEEIALRHLSRAL